MPAGMKLPPGATLVHDAPQQSMKLPPGATLVSDRPDFAANPPGVAKPANPIQTQELQNPRSPNYDAPLPGSTEGAGLTEGLADWDKASFGEMGGGVRDIARGDIAKGMHRTISGTMNATVPVLPFAAAVAPAAVARGALAGWMGGKVAHTGAEVLGATPDQADLAGDVGNIAGGGLGVKGTGGRVGAVAKLGAQDVLSHVPLVGRIVRRPSAMDYVQAAIKGQPSPPVYPGAPLPETPSDVFFQGKGLSEGGKPGVDPAAGLGEIPVRGSTAESFLARRDAEASPIAQTPAAQQSAAPPPAPNEVPRAIPKGQWRKAMDEQLGKALGAKELDPKMPLRNQVPGRMPAEPESALPEGHKAVDSSALRSYGYKPDVREFEARATSGDTIYIYGDVPPEVAAGFEKAPSKGQAWQAIRKYPLVAKIVHGKRIAVKPAD